MKTILYKGKEIPAYPLLMKKVFALDILNGKKTIETRWDSRRYFLMFTDMEKLNENRRLIKEGRKGEVTDALRDDVWAIHFYSTGAPWTLDVLFDNYGLCEANEENIRMLQNEYNFHDFDDLIEEYKDLPDGHKPLLYWFHIDEIVSHQGLV